MPKLTIIVNNKEVHVTELELTGAQIKEIAGLPQGDLLEEVIKGDERVTVNDDQLISIKSGLHFIAHPGGQDS